MRPVGIPVGGFLLFPQFTAYGTYDSSVFRTTDNTLDDFFFTFSPSLRLKANWGLNALELYGGANAYQYDFRIFADDIGDPAIGQQAALGRARSLLRPVGVAPQYASALGKTANCQSALGHKTRARMCPAYVAGLIGPGDRKSIQPMAARDNGVSYDQLHHFIGSGVWDAAPLEAALQVEADKLVGGASAWLIIDDTALPKKGRHSSPTASTPDGMVRISGGDFDFKVEGTEIEGHNDAGVDVQYPWEPGARRFHQRRLTIKSFYMDKFPVTNAAFKKFLDVTYYHPADDPNFLKDWKNGTYPQGWDNKPVTRVSLEDARAYAARAGKRLPHEWEWRWAAQAVTAVFIPGATAEMQCGACRSP